MSDEPVTVRVEPEKKKLSRYQRLKALFTGKTPESVLAESDRFSKMGYFQYPQQHQLQTRLFHLMDILDEIDTELEDIERKKPSELEPLAYRNIKRLFQAFMTIGSPWFRGLDNRELARKAVAFFELETMVGHLPAFYPDLKLCTETLINLSWQAIDVTAQTPILMETRTQVLPPKERISLDKATVDEI